MALRDRERGQRYAVRWLRRWLDETDPTLDEVAVAAAALAALGGRGHHPSLDLLRAAIAHAAGPVTRA